MKILPLVFLTLTLSFSSFTYATKETPNNSLTILGGYRMGGDFIYQKDAAQQSIDLENSNALGAIYAWDFDGKRQGELLYSYANSSLEAKDPFVFNNTDLGISYLHLGGNVPISSGPIPVKVSGGLGVSYFDPKNSLLDSETHFSFNIGLQSDIPLTDNLALTFGARVYATLFNTDSEILCAESQCAIYVESDLWLQSEFTTGLVFRF